VIISSFITIALILFVASFLQGLTGFGFALISMPLLSLIIDIREAIPLCAIFGLLISLYLMYQLKDHVIVFELKRLIVGALVGIPIGVYFLAHTGPVLLQTILAIIIITFVTLTLSGILKPIGLDRKWGYLFGSLSGILGGAFNTGGPPVLVYVYLQGWDKNKQKASLSGYFVVTAAFVVVSHAITGITTLHTLSYLLYFLPFVLFGLMFGSRLFNRISSGIYSKMVLIGLLGIGLFTISRTF